MAYTVMAYIVMALHSYGARCAVVGLGAVLPNHNRLSKQRWTTMANSQAGPRRQRQAEKHNFPTAVPI